MHKMNVLGTKFLSLPLLFLIIMVSSCSKDPKAYEINGKLDNIEGPYFFISYESNDSIRIDTIPVNAKGEFSFTSNKIDTLTEVSLYFNLNTKSTYILVDKGWNVELKGDVLYPDLINVKGGDVNNDLTSFKNDNKELLKARADILNSAENAKKGIDTLEVKDYVSELKNINFELSNIASNYVKANPNKIASVMLINTFFKDESTIPRLDENLEMLKGKAAMFNLTEDLRQFSRKVTQSSVGSIAPNFSIQNMQGKMIHLVDFRGKYILLTFAATTCDVCRVEKPDAIAIYNQLKKEKKDIEFITIVKDIEEVPISENISDSVKWNILPVHGGWSARPFEQYYVREMPYNILIAPTGAILERNFPIYELPEKMKTYTDK